MNPFFQSFCRRCDVGSLQEEEKQAIISEGDTEMIKNTCFSVEILGGYLHWRHGGSRGGAHGDAAQRAPCGGTHVTRVAWTI